MSRRLTGGPAGPAAEAEPPVSMKAPPQAATGPATTPVPSERPPRSLRSWLSSLIVVGIVAGSIMGFFLWIFPAKHFTVPVGWDQSEYIWRTKYAQVVGLEHIDEAPGSAKSAKSGRPAYPVLGATLSSVEGLTPFRVAEVLPSVMAAVIGLAAGAFVAAVLRRPPWQLIAVSLGVSLSPVVVRLMHPEAYMDNMFAASVFLAAAIPLALATFDRRALLPAVLLLGAGATIHWAFFAFVAVALALVGAAYVPTSWRAWRSGRTGIVDTPTARIGLSVAGGALIGAGMIFAVLRNGLPRPRVDVSEFTKKLRIDLPKYRFPFTIPLAVVGAAALGAGSRPKEPAAGRSRFALVFLLCWCAVALGGLLAKILLHVAVPAHRFLAFALAVPVLGVIGMLWVAGLLGRLARPLTAAAVVLSLLAAAKLAHDQWFLAKTWTDPAKVEAAATTAAYLEAAGVPTDRPVVFIVDTRDWNSAALWGHMIRASMPGTRIPGVYVYLGSAETYLAHRPENTRISERYFQRVEPAYTRHPVAVIPAAFNKRHYVEWVGAHPDSEVRDQVAVVEGPLPPPRIPPPGPPIGPPVGRVSLPYLLLLGSISLVVLGLVGLGWAVALLRRWLRPFELVAVAPAVGVAALVMGGIVVDGVGFRLIGLPGALTPVVAALPGWVLGVRTPRRQGMAPPPAA